MSKVVYTFTIEKGYKECWHPIWCFLEVDSTWLRHSKLLFQIHSRTDKEKGLSIFRAYAFRAQDVDLRNQLAIETLSTLSRNLPSSLSSKLIQRSIKNLKIERVVYSPEYDTYIPYKHRNKRKGFRLSRVGG